MASFFIFSRISHAPSSVRGVFSAADYNIIFGTKNHEPSSNRRGVGTCMRTLAELFALRMESLRVSGAFLIMCIC